MSLRHIYSPRYLVRLLQAFILRFKTIILIGVFFGIIFFLGLSILLNSLILTNVDIGVTGRFTPSNMPDDIALKLSSGLTKVDTDGNVSPALAESWETPDDGKTWIFKINENSTWQDGNKVTTSDINYEFSDANIELVDSKTIKFNLNSNFAGFPLIVSKPIFKKGLLGTSDWKVKSVSLKAGYLQKLVIVNKKIKNSDEVNKITYKFYPSDERLRLAFKLGEVDVMTNLSSPEPFDSWKTTSIKEEVNYNNFVGIFFNTEDEKFADKTIRQSLAYAIEKDGFQEGVRAISPISPNSWGYNPQVKQYQKDLEKTTDAKDTKIILSTLPNLLEIAERIKKDWEAAGIETEIQVTTTVPETYQAFLATVDIPKDPDQYSLWHSTQTSTNISKYKNPRIDKLLEDGRTQLDQETRKKIYLDFQRFLVEDVPAIFLYHPKVYEVSRK